ncbi:MAG: hypothetical protein HQK77_05270 [Desulfobacterales bacterium]|nr:hypothetical protein [Desulfobacterales bacterium]
MICRRQVADIQENINEFLKRDLRLIVIGNGQPNFIEGFKKDTKFQGEIYTDPSLNTYKLLHFKKSVASLFGFKTIKSAINAITTGYGQKGIQGDAFQQGGVVVIYPDNTPVYFYISNEAGDHPPVSEIIKAL